MSKLDPETRNQILELRDAILADVTDKTDPRYLELVARIRAREEERESSTARAQASNAPSR
jgi:hypothetical protein